MQIRTPAFPFDGSLDEGALRLKLAARWPVKGLIIRSLNLILEAVAGRSLEGDPPHGIPQRILLASAGHLGDMVIMRAILDGLKSALPEVEFGALVPPWSAQVMEGHPALNRIHAHAPLFGKPGQGKAKGALGWIRNLPGTVFDLGKAGYDLAFDLRQWAPSYALELALARIPHRFGFQEALGAPLYSSRLDSPPQDRVLETELQFRLVACAGYDLPRQPAALPAPGPEVMAAWSSFALEHQLGPKPFRVFHVGASREAKGWVLGKWRELLAQQEAKGIRVVFTGAGAKDLALVRACMMGSKLAVNAVNALPWPVFVTAMQQAELVFTVDTVAGHIAAAAGTPCVIVFCGVEDPGRFAPVGANVRVLAQPVACYPCLLPYGCAQRPCVACLEVEEVARAGEDLIR